MELLDKVRVIVYRYNQKGLEIFLMPSEEECACGECLKLADPKGFELDLTNKNVIELESAQEVDGQMIKTIAIEGEWHDIPSIRKMIKKDIKLVKHTIKEMIPGIEKGAFFAVKEAVKQVMPAEYKAVKELKDILLDRNVAGNI